MSSRKDTDFDNILSLLFQNFHLDGFDNQNSLESSIVDYINQLKKFKLYIPIIYIVSIFKALRAEKIQFWEYILKKYQERKKDFDERLFFKIKDQEKLTKELVEEFKEEFVKTGEFFNKKF